jgi:TM2 domain-containing membrane protein YozV
MNDLTSSPIPDPTISPAALQEANSKKIAAGICAILLGSLGIHKFILGMTSAGLIMLLSTVLTCGLAAAVFHVISLVEGVLYLTKTDEEFYRIYIAGKKEWF